MKTLRSMVKKYADGGEVTHQGLDMSRVSPEQLRMMQRSDPQAMMRGVARFSGQEVAEPQGSGLASMYERVMSQPSPYAAEYKEAQARATEAQSRFEELLTKQSQSQVAPSKAELYFNLAAAFGAPTQSGQFMESVGNAAKVMGADAKERRASELAHQKAQQNLALTVAQARAQSSREDSQNVRQLASEEMREKRAIGLQAMKDYYDSGKPQSEAGKAALDSGLKRGTPEYTAFVRKYIDDKTATGNVFKEAMQDIAGERLELAKRDAERKDEAAKKLTPGEMKLKTESEDMTGQLGQALKDLSDAFKLNPDTFSGSMVDRAQYELLSRAGSEDPKVINTGRLKNLLGQSALGKLRATFGGAPTEGERQILMDLEGVGSRSIPERKEIIARAYKVVKERHAREQKRLADIVAGKYRDSTQEPTLPEELSDGTK